MRRSYLLLIVLFSQHVFSQDQNMDNSMISKESEDLVHLLPMFCYAGVPQNQNESDKLTILINHGFAVGFSPSKNQPLWAIYALSRVREEVSYDRSQFFYNDQRLPSENQIGVEGFGNGFDRGHMVPNAAINNQFGRLAQMETFLMSNICPQKSGLNQGMWADFEDTIREVYAQTKTTPKESAQNIWVIVGPIFPSNVEFIERNNGAKVAIPEAFYAIVVDPFRYPYERPGNSNFMALIFDQNVKKSDNYSNSLLKSINEIEYRTGLNFFPEFTDYYENKIEEVKASSIWK